MSSTGRARTGLRRPHRRPAAAAGASDPRRIWGGIAELREQRLRPGVSHIRLTDVTERADVTCDRLRIWTQPHPRRPGRPGPVPPRPRGRGVPDHAHRLPVTDRGRGGAPSRRRRSPERDGPDHGRRALPVVVRRPHRRGDRARALRGDPDRSRAQCGAAETTPCCRPLHRGARLGLEWYGRDMADGLSVRDLVVSITALATGFLVRHGLEPEIATRPAGPAEHEWTLFGYCVWALIDRFTRPAGDPAEPVTPAARPRSAARPL